MGRVVGGTSPGGCVNWGGLPSMGLDVVIGASGGCRCVPLTVAVPDHDLCP